MTNPANSPYVQARERVFIIMNAMNSAQRRALIQEIVLRYAADINPRRRETEVGADTMDTRTGKTTS